MPGRGIYKKSIRTGLDNRLCPVLPIRSYTDSCATAQLSVWILSRIDKGDLLFNVSTCNQADEPPLTIY